MFFRLIYSMDLWLVGEQSREITYAGDPNIVVRIESHPPSDVEANPELRRQALCSASTDLEPPLAIHEMFKSLAQGRMPVGSRSPKPLPSYIFEDGTIAPGHNVPFSYLPTSLESFVNDFLFAKLHDYAIRTVRVLRWRFAQPGPHTPVKAAYGLKWSLDNKSWQTFPTLRIVHGVPFGPLDLTDDRHLVDAITQVEEGLSEPLGHELYREAWDQRVQNPRSALVIGYAAAEVGFKECATFLVPDIAWFVENLASPPLDQVLTKYFPKLPVKLKISDGDPFVPNKIVHEVREGMRLRNKTAHTKGQRLSTDALEAILRAIQDLLWLFDYHCGHAWALNNIRPEIRDALTKTF
jgi:hypothetical protein